MNYTAELIVDAKAVLGESPLWDQNKKVLFWIDGAGKKIHKYNPLTGKDTFINANQWVGCIALMEDGNLIAALQNGIYYVNFEEKTFDFITNPEEHLPQNRFNDGKCDAYGRFWAGTMYIDASVKGAGSLYKMEGLKVTKVLSNVTISNGPVWSIDNRTMYYTDSPTREISGFDFNIESGTITNKKTVIKIREDEGIPDGMTIDEEGYLWIAHWGGGKISRWNPGNGKKISEIKVSTLNVSCCTFGGENLDELYITTGRLECSSETLKTYPHSGGLYKVKVSTKGMKSSRYKKNFSLKSSI
ncbi:MAG: SMP-30/gluconolactonase/LRE family protein [Atribacterota bacterium]|nr:SMP-30/gluconolactonase/LRE family protein [Atribacterota bacterium]